jgi:hypothetical protein
VIPPITDVMEETPDMLITIPNLKESKPEKVILTLLELLDNLEPVNITLLILFSKTLDTPNLQETLLLLSLQLFKILL